MSNIYTIRNLPRGIRARLKAFAQARGMRIGAAIAYLISRAIEKEKADKKKPYTLADYKKFVFKGRHKDGSKMVDEVVYGGRL